MLSTITFDQKTAAQADAPRAISQSGKYVGMIAYVEPWETENGAEMIEIQFRSEEGASAIRACIRAKDGSETRFMGMLQAIMGLTGVKALTPKACTLKNRDGSDRQAYYYPELSKKRIGFVLQRVNDCYTGKDGKTHEFYQMAIARVFDPETGKTYHETIGGKEAKSIEAVLKTLSDYDTKRLQDYRAGGANAQAAGNDIPDEDIPF